MKQKWIILLSLVALAAACSNNGQQRSRIRPSVIPSSPGSRLAAVLNKGTSCNNFGSLGGNLSGFGNSFQNPLQPISVPGQQAIQNSNLTGNLGGLNSGVGSVQVISLFEESSLIGQPGNFSGQSGGNQFLSSGVAGIPVGLAMSLQGITEESQIAYTSDGGLLLVTLPDLNGGEVVGIPMYDGGGMGSAYRIGVGPHPTEIATAKAADGVEYAVVTTRAGLSILAMDRVDARTGTPVPGALRERVRIDLGMPTAAAFSPSGEWIFVGTNPTGRGGNSNAGGRVYVCRREQIVNGFESPLQTLGREELGRGCYAGDSGLYAGTTNGYPNPFATGRQSLPGVPIKIAVSNNLAVTLTNPMGPYVLRTPDIEDMDKQPDDFWGYLQQTGWVQSNSGVMGNSFRDIAIHPRSGNIIAVESGRLLIIPMDNTNERRTRQTGVDEIRMGTRLSSIGMDPGPNAEFALVTDEGSGRVLIGRLDALSVRFNRVSDFIQMTGGCPIDVAVRTRTQLR